MTTQVPEKTMKYFQYQKGHKLPVFVRFDSTSFGSDLGKVLGAMRFSETTESEYNDALKHSKDTRILDIQEASPAVARQIAYVASSDRYGAESIVPKDGYRVYRHKNVALIVYAFSANEWSMGCDSSFGSDDSQCRVVINRYLSWALAPHGIVGFWGVPVEEGIVVMNQRDSLGEAVFVDVRGRRTFSIDGSDRMKARFRVIRLDGSLHNKNLKMNSSEMMAFLAASTSFIDASGLSVGIRQLIQSMARDVEGLVHPRESFKPRTDLSL
ncbi:MAG: hypothetical protein CME71_11060 [Halobacteriovorax sp.]|nr:hypothetical protein [Halobacteriovorax sp.]